MTENKQNQEKKFEEITKRDIDFSEWYLDIIKYANLAENSPVRGCMIIKQNGYAIWENIQKILDKEFKKRGTENVYFPLLIPKSFLEKEAEHVEGFAKECAVVTHHRLAQDENHKLIPESLLEEPLIIRPTSETIMYDAFSKWIRSHRDLPLNINQWCNVMRWELRTKPFLRTSEFLWQEGHTAHSSKEEAENKALEMLSVYKNFVEDYLAIKCLDGKKTESEKFAGADWTSTIETMMQDGKALQSGTSHHLGQNFAKSFDVSFLNDKQEKEFVWQTSWGLSTRIIGAIIMSHSDDKGLVLPPKIAPIQIVMIPIFNDEEQRKNILEKIEYYKNIFIENNISFKVDDREGRPGFKYFEWERKGVPLRLEIGPKDLEKDSVCIVDRLLGEKNFIKEKEVLDFIKNKLSEIQNTLFKNSEERLKNNIKEVKDFSEFKDLIENQKVFIYTHLCEDKICEEKIKEETGATSRCIPFKNDFLEAGEKNIGKCIYCKAEANKKVIFAKAY